jgi:hypothetical protein
MAGYGSDDAFQAWLSGNGHALPAGAPAAVVLRQRGSAYIDATYGLRFPGQPVGGFDQDRAWPRAGAVLISGAFVPPDIVPNAVEQASYAAAFQEAVSPGSLSVVGSVAGRVKREKVEGAVEVEYQVGGDMSAAGWVPILTAVEGLLATLLVPVAPIPGIVVV